jgi:hypothetical protein
MKNKCVAVIVSLIVVAAMGAAPVLANDTTFSGQATGVRATLLGIPITPISDTGPLPASGGALETSLINGGVPGLLTVQVFHSTTVGQGNQSRSEASVADLNITAAGNTIGAEFLMARATAKCSSNGQPSVSGSSELAELVINGQTIDAGTPPNTTINLPGGSQVIINEQTSNPPGNPGDLTVNALHVIVKDLVGNTVADVIVASAHADISCGRPPCESSKDFVTGGGWIERPGGRANFAVAGGIKNGYWGHLQYIDHVSDMKVKGTGVTAYMIMDGTLRHIEGTCEINGASGYTYQADVSDVAEPGKGADTFRLRLLPNGSDTPIYDTGVVTLAGGNIQLHFPCN